METADVLVAGETLVDFVPETPGPLSTVEGFARRAGGAPANVAAGLAALDRTPWLCTTLSTDPFGDALAEALADASLPDRFVTRTDHPTALAFVSHDTDADRSFTFYREDTADTHLDTSVVDDATLSGVDYCVLGGVPLTAEPARGALFDLADRARAAGCRVVFDPNTRPELWADDADPAGVLRRMLALSDVMKATREDLAGVGILDEDRPVGEQLLALGPDTVFLTHGAAGASVVVGKDAPWPAGTYRHDGYDPGAVVDTTGAGDAFLAGAVAAMCDDCDPEATLSVATATAALATTERGAMAALPDREAVDALRGRE